jgi:hypothetical protein
MTDKNRAADHPANFHPQAGELTKPVSFMPSAAF